MRSVATGTLGRVLFARLEPGDDIYLSIIEIVKEERIQAGVILDMTGAASQLRLALPKSTTEGSRPPQILEVGGLTEIMGSGIIGRVEDDFVSGDGHVSYVKGEPYAHIHISACVNGETFTGHLVEGTLVRSVISRSHFTVALAEVDGVDFALRVEHNDNPDYPAGVPYHTVERANP